MGRLSWGGGGQMGGGPGQIGAKSWIFQTELGPIAVINVGLNAFSHQVGYSVIGRYS